MTAIVLRTASRYLLPLLVVFSVFLLLRGHNEPGGGFVGGLVLASGLVLHALAFGAAAARRMLRIDPRALVGLGLLVALASATCGVVAGRPFLASVWIAADVPFIGTMTVGTPLLFDCGVYLLVAGVTLVIVLELAREER